MAGFGNRRQVVSGSGGNFSVLDLKKIEGTHEFFKLEEGANRIEILPYVAESKDHPLIAKGKLEKGDLDYNLAVYVHKNIGAAGGSYVCPKFTYNKPCPICEAMDEYKKAGKDTESKALYPSQRLFYNILNNMDREKGIQIFETNAKYFQKPLEAADKDSQTDTDIQEKCPDAFFADTKNGLTVKVVGAKEKFNGKDFIQASSITLLPRKESVKEFVKDVIPFDQCLKLHTYDELEAIFTGADEGDAEPEEEEAPVVKKATKPPVEEDDDDEPPAKPTTKAPVEDDEPTCPVNPKWWGVANDTKPECSKCDNKTFKACMKASM